MVQNVDEVERVLDNSSVGLCLDTGHLACMERMSSNW